MFNPLICRSKFITRQPLWSRIRYISTLPDNPYIYVFSSPNVYTLSFLPTDPPTQALSIGFTTQTPPVPSSFNENPAFLPIVHEVLAKHAASDPDLQGQAAAFASNSTSSSNFRGLSFPQRTKSRRRLEESETLANRGGWIHVNDLRAPPDYGRIAWPEDIFGSMEVDGDGNFVPGVNESSPIGNYQPCGTYRIVTSNGIIKLSDFLRLKLIERLTELEREHADPMQ
ncbi:hypothetical protein OnM2_058037 [Erysiphe neolycopersici]|uniref:Uncharacterized protein n=1 Tax=Erysiphe neolycopersici TaxID=212602 RepID=A0A420HQJ5_9PEZI|nr:hypothetical protein OnM2_058037 [Erysiphe neolycopersici]